MEKFNSINKDLEQTKQDFEALLKQSATLEGKISASNRFRLQSKKKYGAISLIEKTFYTITGRIHNVDGTTTISYKSRGNNTFSVLAVIIPIFSFPTFLFYFIGTETTNFKNPEILPFLMGFTVIIATITLLLLFREKQLKRKGEKVFEEFLVGLEHYSS
jgi:hypothetical protein